MLGYYVGAAGVGDPEVVKLSEQKARKSPITRRPANLLAPEWDSLRTQALALKGCNGSDEDVLTHALFPQVAPGFFQTRARGPRSFGVPCRSPEQPALSGPVKYAVTFAGKTHNVTVAPL